MATRKSTKVTMEKQRNDIGGAVAQIQGIAYRVDALADAIRGQLWSCAQGGPANSEHLYVLADMLTDHTSDLAERCGAL